MTEYVEPGMEQVVLALHKKVDGRSFSVVDPMCCGQKTLIRVIPFPFVKIPRPEDRATWGQTHWSASGIWISSVYAPDFAQYDIHEGHATLDEALDHIRTLVNQYAKEPTPEWMSEVRALPDRDSVSPSEKEMATHKIWHASYWRDVEREMERDEQDAEEANNDPDWIFDDGFDEYPYTY